MKVNLRITRSQIGLYDQQQEGVQLLSDDFLYSAEKTLSNWTINSNF